MSNSQNPLPIRPVSKMDLLPHFTPMLCLELRSRLKRRLCDERGIEVNEAESIAATVVRKMYRTQLREARALISFSECILNFNWPDSKQPTLEQA